MAINSGVCMFIIDAQDGQTSVEYALVAAAAVSAVIALTALAAVWSDKVASIADAIASAL